jgi:hypothetical protein
VRLKVRLKIVVENVSEMQRGMTCVVAAGEKRRGEERRGRLGVISQATQLKRHSFGQRAGDWG